MLFARKRLNVKIFGTDGTAKYLDEYIKQL